MTKKNKQAKTQLILLLRNHDAKKLMDYYKELTLKTLSINIK